MPLSDLRNLGPRSSEMLESIGIKTKEDLERIGSVRAAFELVRAGHEISLNMLYAIEGALEDIDWRDLSPDLKSELRREFDEIKR